MSDEQRPPDSQKPWLHGRKPGDRRVRVERPHAAFFRYSGPGTLVARESASVPRTAAGRALESVRHVLFGRRLSIHEEIGERLTKKKALAIFSSDAISSSAYATEEILRVLVLAGAAALLRQHPDRHRDRPAAGRRLDQLPPDRLCLSLGRRRLRRGAANLPGIFALVVAGALLVDYVMTVAVSTSSAVEQVISAVPGARATGALPIAAGAILLIMLGNLRGLRESGNIFAIPTYLFVVLDAADDRHRHLPDRRPRRGPAAA